MRKNMKGTTVIEVVISFAIVALAVGIGLMGIGIGANFMNSGSTYKRQRMEAESNMTESVSENVKNVKIDGTDVPAKKFIVTDDTGNEIFVEYRPQ